MSDSIEADPYQPPAPNATLAARPPLAQIVAAIYTLRKMDQVEVSDGFRSSGVTSLLSKDEIQ